MSFTNLNSVNTFTFNSVFFAILGCALDEIYLEIEKKYRFFLSETALINLNIIWKKLSIVMNENPSDSLILIENFTKFTQFNLNLEKITDCLQAIAKLTNFLKKDQESLFIFLDNFLQNEITLRDWLRAVEYMKDLKKEVSALKQLMNVCNEAIRHALSQAALTLDELEILKKEFNSFKAEISQYISPLLTLPFVMDELIVEANKTKNQNNKFYKPDLDDNIKDLFNIDFNKFIRLVKSKEVEKAPSIVNVETKINPSLPQNAPKTVNHKNAIQNSDLHIDNNPPETTRTGKIIAHLKDQGWIPTTTTGSHLKLFKSQELLIVPINVKNIPKGTLGAIYREKEEKEFRIVEKSELKIETNKK